MVNIIGLNTNLYGLEKNIKQKELTRDTVIEEVEEKERVLNPIVSESYMRKYVEEHGGGGQPTSQVLVPEQTLEIDAAGNEFTEVELSGVTIDTTNFPVYIPLTVDGVTIAEVYGEDIAGELYSYYSEDLPIGIAYYYETEKWVAGTNQSGTYIISSTIVPDTNEYITLIEEQTITEIDGDLILDTNEVILKDFIPELKITLDGTSYHVIYDSNWYGYAFGNNHMYLFAQDIDQGVVTTGIYKMNGGGFTDAHTVKVEAPLPKTNHCVVTMTGDIDRGVVDYFDVAESGYPANFFFVRNDNVLVNCNAEYINGAIPADYQSHCFIPLTFDSNGTVEIYTKRTHQSPLTLSNKVNINESALSDYYIMPVDATKNAAIEMEISSGGGADV